MKTKKYAALFSVLLLFIMSSSVCEAKIWIPQLLSDNMVLQQQSQANIWGKAEGEVTISVSWTKKKFHALCDKDGSWRIAISTPVASYTNQTITIKDRNSHIVLKDILIGEVWLCGGQSNMEMPLGGMQNCSVEGASEEIAQSSHWMDKIRQVKIEKRGSLEKTDSVAGKWTKPAPMTSQFYSAVGWAFAKMLNQVLDVPVGLLECNWSASAVESWIPEEIVENYPDSTLALGRKYFKDLNGNWNAASSYVMFNAMIYPIHNFTLKGFLWYQGETNVKYHSWYSHRLSEMVRSWRELWNQGNLPFYLVELAPFEYEGNGDGIEGALLREAQHEAVSIIPNSGIVVTNDLVYPYESELIHPSQKKEVGYRLAYQALHKTYLQMGIECDGPVYKDIQIVGNEMIISFKGDEYGFCPNQGIVGFEVAGADKIFHLAEARICNPEHIAV